MKRSILLVAAFLFFVYHGSAQGTGIIVTCNDDEFFGLTGNDIYRLQFDEDGVILGSLITSYTAGGSLAALAVANDQSDGNGDLAFYSSTFSGLDNSLVAFQNGFWETLQPDTTVSHNGGGIGEYIYYQTVGNDFSVPRLARYFNGELTEVPYDLDGVFSVSDISVDQDGNIYAFTGNSIPESQFLKIISPLGEELASYELEFNGSGFYGSFIMNNKIYLGVIPALNTITPITLDAGVATMGDPINMPDGFTFKDLASCGNTVMPEVVAITEARRSECLVYPTIVSDWVNIKSPASGTLRVLSATGNLVYESVVGQGISQVDLGGLAAGTYFVRIQTLSGQQYVGRLIRE